MAENEYLDSTKARRWQSVALAISEGCDDDELLRRVRDRFYKALRNIRKDLPLTAVIQALDDPAMLNQICESIEGAGDVKHIVIQAAQDAVGRENILERFLHGALQNCLYDIPYIAAQMSDDLNISESRRRLDTAFHRLRPELRRMAEKFAANPSWIPRQVAHAKTNSSQVDSTQEMLGESLIAGFKR